MTLHVCFVSPLAFPPFDEGSPGLKRHTWAMANGLADRGIQVSIISTDAKSVAEKPNITSYRIHRPPRIASLFGLNFLQMSREALSVYTRLVATQSVDIINVQEQSGIAFARNKKALKSKLVAFCHGVHGAGDIWDHLIWRPFVVPLQREVFRGADWIFAANDPAIVKRFYGIKSDNITSIYNGADQKEFDAIIGNRHFLAWVKRKYRIDGFPTILYVGPVIRRKRVHMLIEAFRELGNYPRARLLIAGGETSKDYFEYCRGRCAGANISMLGYTPEEELVALYHLADVFVLPSKAEGLPQVLMESLMGGTPVVAPDSGAVRSLVEENRVGYTFDPDVLNKTKLREKIELCLTNLAELRENVQRSRHRFSWDVTVEKVLTIYEQLLQDRS